MKFEALSNAAIITEIGTRLQRERLNQNITQSSLAQKAGISRRVLQDLESGCRPCTIASLVKVLRALGRLDTLDAFLPEPGVSPLQLAKLKGRKRLRASGAHLKKRP